MEFEHDAEDARIARLSALIATVNGDGKKSYEPSDFMPKRRHIDDPPDGQSEEERRLSAEETAEHFKQLALSLGGNVVEKDGTVVEAPKEPHTNGSG